MTFRVDKYKTATRQYDCLWQGVTQVTETYQLNHDIYIYKVNNWAKLYKFVVILCYTDTINTGTQ